MSSTSLTARHAGTAAATPPRIEVLQLRTLALARQLQPLLELAHAQEAALLQLEPGAAAPRSVAELQASGEFFLGAFVGHTLAGALGLGPDDEAGQIHISTLVVHPAQQRRGVASGLLINALGRVGAATLSVTTGAANAPALALYRKLGFCSYRQGVLGPQRVPMLKLRRAGAPATASEAGSAPTRAVTSPIPPAAAKQTGGATFD